MFCGSAIPERGVYCPNCGAVRQSLRHANIPPAGLRRLPYEYASYYPSAQKRAPVRQIVKTVSAYVMLSFLAQLALSIVVLVYGATVVTPVIVEASEAWTEHVLFLAVPFIVPLVTLSGSTLLAYYYLLIVAIIASCTVFFVRGAGPFFKELMMNAKSREHSVVFATVGLLFATLFFSLLVALLSDTSADEVPEAATTAEYLFVLANASVWEEIIVRILMIGLPLLVVDFARRRRQTRLRSYVIGGGFEMGILEVLLLIASSAIFGIAHFTGGWGAWKILPAAVGGLAFGYLFLRYGIAASVTLHFGTDYLSMPIEISDSVGLALITGVGIVLWAAFGLVFFVYYVVRVIEFLSGRRLLEPKPVVAVWGSPWPVAPPPSPQLRQGQWQPEQQIELQEGVIRGGSSPAPPPQRAGVMGGYVCPRCGGVEARWKDGRFECLRCGFLS
ncbi:MAG: CPBP family intramembrane metalloprotease [Candidatus Thermoplasmatota archaeon]|nr:CPBP family intramembrane metalloprotease [Candidatus Thermoplasmatota archaeon]